MALKSLNEFSYEWLRVLKYNYLRKNTQFNESMDDKASLRSRSNKSSHKTISMHNQYEQFQVNQMVFSIDYDFEYLGNYFMYRAY